jgi:hypothetical protein
LGNVLHELARRKESRIEEQGDRFGLTVFR